jgi:hypothetical protein
LLHEENSASSAGAQAAARRVTAIDSLFVIVVERDQPVGSGIISRNRTLRDAVCDDRLIAQHTRSLILGLLAEPESDRASHINGS